MVPSHPDPHDFDENDVVVTHEKSYTAGVLAVLVSLRRGLEQMVWCGPLGFLRGQSMNVYSHGHRVTAAN